MVASELLLHVNVRANCNQKCMSAALLYAKNVLKTQCGAVREVSARHGMAGRRSQKPWNVFSNFYNLPFHVRGVNLYVSCQEIMEFISLP